MGILRLRAKKRKKSRWWNVQFAFRQCSFSSLCEEKLEPIPQITCSLIQASSCSIDTVVRTLDPNALLIALEEEGGETTQHRSVPCTMFTPLSCVTPTTNIYIIYIILNCVILPGGKNHNFCVDMVNNSGQTASRLWAEDTFSLHTGLFYWCVSASFTSALLMRL